MTTTNSFIRAAWRADCPVREPDLTYTAVDGYRCHRWNAEGVEMLEHRYIVDPGPGVQVHHRNGIKTDNRRENLEAVTSAEHGVEHRRVADATLVALHRAGQTTVAIGRAVGLHASQVSRRLRAAGLTLGPRPVNKVDMDEADVLRRHDAGARAPHIATALGVPTESVRRVLRSHGRRGRSGRPPKVASPTCSGGVKPGESRLPDGRCACMTCGHGFRLVDGALPPHAADLFRDHLAEVDALADARNDR